MYINRVSDKIGVSISNEKSNCLGKFFFVKKKKVYQLFLNNDNFNNKNIYMFVQFYVYLIIFKQKYYVLL